MMQDNKKLVEALRVCNRIDHVGNCNVCYYGSPDAPPPKQYVNGCKRSMCEDAADAIEALDRLLDKNTKRCEALREQLREAHESYERHLNELEAQLPKWGKWVEESYNNQHNLYRCSVCGLTMLTNPDYVKKHKYCFNCGAKMEVQK